MCGRCRCTLNPQDVSRACGIGRSLPILHCERYHPSHNVSPGSYLPVVRKEHGSSPETVVHCMRWGLIPSFTKKTEKPDHFRMFNARSESICEKASFRRLIPNNRCLVAAEGFFEWKKDGTKRQPYYIHFKDERPLVFAALCDFWVNTEGELISTFTILTTRCSSSLEWLHDRMPVIFGDCDSKNTWLNSTASDKLVSMLQPYEDSDLVWYPVTAMMGKPSFNGPECIKEIPLKHDQQAAISTFFSRNKLESKSDEAGFEFSSKDSNHNDIEENAATKENKKMNPSGRDASGAANEANKDAGKCVMKRNYEQFFVDSDNSEMKTVTYPNPLSVGNINRDKLGSPKKRKGEGNSDGRNQQTLFSYFGKC